jgi:hypothetical protein
VLDGVDVGRFNSLRNGAADGAIVICKRWGFMGVRDCWIDNIANAGGVEVHVKNPTQVQVVGFGTRGFEFLNGGGEFESRVTG